MPRRTAALLLAVALLSSGCVSPQNDRTTIGRVVHLEALTPAAPPPIPGGGERALTPPPQQPSLVAIDRANWEPVAFLVPVDGTAHNPTYATRVVIADTTARQRREYPTALSALELTAGSETQQQLEAPANSLLSAADILLLPARMIWQAPWRTRWSPTIAYARYWRPEHIAPPPAPLPLALPAAPPPPMPPPAMPPASTPPAATPPAAMPPSATPPAATPPPPPGQP